MYPYISLICMKRVPEVAVFPVFKRNPLDWFDFVCPLVHLASLIMKAESFLFYWFNGSGRCSGLWGGGQNTLTYICHNTRTNSFLKWSHSLSKRAAKCYIFGFLFVFMHNNWLICGSCIFIWCPHLQRNMPLSFQTGPRLELPAPERNSGTIRAAAARQPLLQQGSLHRRAAIIC